jgi:hypothetical protein
VCEKPIQKGNRRKAPAHCHDRKCGKDFRRYPDAFSLTGYPDSQNTNLDSGSAHFTGVKNAVPGDRAAAWKQVAGPPIALINLQIPFDRALAVRLGRANTVPEVMTAGDLADAKYVADDEAFLTSCSSLAA